MANYGIRGKFNRVVKRPGRMFDGATASSRHDLATSIQGERFCDTITLLWMPLLHYCIECYNGRVELDIYAASSGTRLRERLTPYLGLEAESGVQDTNKLYLDSHASGPICSLHLPDVHLSVRGVPINTEIPNVP